MAKKSVVAVVETRPETVLEDVGRVMELAGYREALSPEHETSLQTDLSWHRWYPATSTTPWQLEGVIRRLLEDGFSRSRLHGSQSRSVVVSAKRGEEANKHRVVLDAYGLANHHHDAATPRKPYRPKARMRVLDDLFPEGIVLPERSVGANVIHLPTAKTHSFTTLSGAVRNAFGALLPETRHWAHPVIHEALVDLLALQRELHPGLFAVMDGTFAGDGPGPRCMVPHVKNVLLASSDPVAIDSVAARMMGFDPMALRFLRLATEDGLGSAHPDDVEVVGMDIAGINWRFSGDEDTFASRGQRALYWGALKPLQKTLLRTVVTPWSHAASRAYHDVYWYNAIGKPRVREALATPWGRLFAGYERGLAERGRTGR